MNLVPNFMNPILALALVMPYISKNKFVQYLAPISAYCLLEGVYVSQIGLYITLIFATYCANHMSMIKSFILTSISFHVFNFYSMFLHPDSTYVGALVADINLMSGTALYLTMFILSTKLVGIKLHENT